jgi:hypothetical protein
MCRNALPVGRNIPVMTAFPAIGAATNAAVHAREESCKEIKNRRISTLQRANYELPAMDMNSIRFYCII